VIVTPDTVLRWQRRRFREYWTKRSGGSSGGRPPINAEIKALISRMAAANPLWGESMPSSSSSVSRWARRTVSRLLPARRRPPSQTWRTFLANHVQDLVGLDFFSERFRQRMKGMRIGEVLTAPHSPWQNPFVERLIGSVRRECLEHVVVLGERCLRRVLAAYFAYYHRARTHLSLDKDAPDGRPIEPPELGPVISIPQVGGLHHRYVRRAA